MSEFYRDLGVVKTTDQLGEGFYTLNECKCCGALVTDTATHTKYHVAQWAAYHGVYTTLGFLNEPVEDYLNVSYVEWRRYAESFPDGTIIPG